MNRSVKLTGYLARFDLSPLEFNCKVLLLYQFVPCFLWLALLPLLTQSNSLFCSQIGQRARFPSTQSHVFPWRARKCRRTSLWYVSRQATRRHIRSETRHSRHRTAGSATLSCWSGNCKREMTLVRLCGEVPEDIQSTSTFVQVLVQLDKNIPFLCIPQTLKPASKSSDLKTTKKYTYRNRCCCLHTTLEIFNVAKFHTAVL